MCVFVFDICVSQLFFLVPANELAWYPRPDTPSCSTQYMPFHNNNFQVILSYHAVHLLVFGNELPKWYTYSRYSVWLSLLTVMLCQGSSSQDALQYWMPGESCVHRQWRSWLSSRLYGLSLLRLLGNVILLFIGVTERKIARFIQLNEMTTSTSFYWNTIRISLQWLVDGTLGSMLLPTERTCHSLNVVYWWPTC